MRISKKSFIGYLVLLHLLVAVMLLKSDFISKVGARLGINTQTLELTPHYKRMMSYHVRMDGSIPNGSVIFIGDSITQGLATSAVSPFSVNYGIGSDTTFGVLERITKYKSIFQARAIVLAIGVNDFPLRSNALIVDNYKKILDEIPKNIEVIVSAVIPLDNNVFDKIVNSRVYSFNQDLEALTSNYENVKFINVADSLTDSEGNLLQANHIGDGIHLSSKGYDVWIQALKGAL